MIMPGVGFDVVPSDCLALHLKERLPSATHLSLAFYGMGRISHGTQATMTMNVGKGGAIRKDGKITPVPAAWKTREIDFGEMTKTGVTIPWGDVATAFYSTGIPNIEVFTVVPPSASENDEDEPLYRLAACGRAATEISAKEDPGRRPVGRGTRERKDVDVGRGVRRRGRSCRIAPAGAGRLYDNRDRRARTSQKRSLTEILRSAIKRRPKPMVRISSWRSQALHARMSTSFVRPIQTA